MTLRIVLLLLLLLQVLPNVSVAQGMLDQTFDNPLIEAADKGNLAEINRLLGGGISPNAKGDFGTTALMRAALKGNAEIVELLITRGADVNAKDIGGATAMHLASRAGHTSVVELLIKYGANASNSDSLGFTPIQRARNNDQTEVVQKISTSSSSLPSTLPPLKIKKLEEQPVASIAKTTEPEAPQTELATTKKTGKIKVAEAIKLEDENQLQRYETVETPMIKEEKPVDTIPAEPDWAHVKFEQIASEKVIREIWLEMTAFESEDEAIETWQELVQDPFFSKAKMKLITNKNIPGAKPNLRIGTFFKAKDVMLTCQMIKDKINDRPCYLIHDIY